MMKRGGSVDVVMWQKLTNIPLRHTEIIIGADPIFIDITSAR